MAEIPEELPLVGPITLEPGIPYCFIAWGIHFRLTKYGEWRYADVGLNSKSDAEDWIKKHYKLAAEAEAIPVKRCLLLNEKGIIKSWAEELA